MLALGAGFCLFAAPAAPAEKNVRTIRLIQDDAQDYMVSKIYRLKYLKANDVTPFLLGVVKRYNRQSTVNRINYKAANEQLPEIRSAAPASPARSIRPGSVPLR